MIPSLPPVDRMADSGRRNRRAIGGQMAGRRGVMAAGMVQWLRMIVMCRLASRVLLAGERKAKERELTMRVRCTPAPSCVAATY